MGDKYNFQPLTQHDKATVVLYRAGIILAALSLCIAAYFILINAAEGFAENQQGLLSGAAMGMLLLLLYFGVGLSVFFIHLYVGKFYRILKKIYYVSVICLAILFFIGNGNPAIPLFRVPPYGALLLIPLSLCLGFVTAKEAFCFKLLEGYLLAMLMPAYIFFCGVGLLDQRKAALGLVLIAVLLVIFTLRKVFMPLHYDIGDKSAYQP